MSLRFSWIADASRCCFATACSGYVEAREEDKILTLVFISSDRYTFPIEASIPWNVDISDPIRCDLTALVACSRLNFLRQMRNARTEFDTNGNEHHLFTLSPIMFITKHLDPSTILTPKAQKRVKLLIFRVELHETRFSLFVLSVR